MIGLVGQMAFFWFLVALAVLDAENLWLPDWITLPGTVLGIVITLLQVALRPHSPLSVSTEPVLFTILRPLFYSATSILLASGLVLLIRGAYWLVRRREGIGLGDAKLMAMLAAWLGFFGALLAFGIGVVLGAIVALALITTLSGRGEGKRWALTKLPLGTFLCVGGIVSSLWGPRIMGTYLHWAGFL